MRVTAGFTEDRASVSWARAKVHPPASLKAKVFPFLAERIAEWKGSETEKAGHDFLLLLSDISEYFLQDCASVRKKVCFLFLTPLVFSQCTLIVQA
jgi:hypothetical protein